MENFRVKVVRVEGSSPVTGEFLEQAAQELTILAHSRQSAYKKSLILSTLEFKGQLRRTFIDGVEHFDENN